MKSMMTFALAGLLATGAFAQQGVNTPRSSRQDKPQPPAQAPNPDAGRQSQAKTSQNMPGRTPNRNDDRVIGNKNDNVMPVDTARGRGSDAPHAKTPQAVKDKSTPETGSSRTNTPNSMVPPPGNPNISNDYNRSANGGMGSDTSQVRDTHNPFKANGNLPSAKRTAPADNTKVTAADSTTVPDRNRKRGSGAASLNATGKTKSGTTGTGYSTGSNAGENAGNTRPGNNPNNRTSTIRGAAPAKKDSLR